MNAAVEGETANNKMPNVGDTAPDFTLPSHNEGELNLAWYRGRKNVVLAFYPGDWTPGCSNQIPGYNKRIEEFDALNCQLLGISVDSVACHVAWAKSFGGLHYPLMADFYPHGAVARQYGVFNETYGTTDRVVFLIDIEGVIRFIQRPPNAAIPDNEELFEQIKALENSAADR